METPEVLQTAQTFKMLMRRYYAQLARISGRELYERSVASDFRRRICLLRRGREGRGGAQVETESQCALRSQYLCGVPTVTYEISKCTSGHNFVRASLLTTHVKLVQLLLG